MELSVFVEIKKPVEEVWKTITDFENCSNYIESIINLKIIEQPNDTLIGFTWEETRVMFGKESTEKMWITDYTENESYQTRAESHGSVYVSKLSIEKLGENTKLTMSFDAKAEKILVKIISACMGFMMKGLMKKALLKDLNDIKNHLETN